MTRDDVISLSVQALEVAAKLALPMLGVSLILGLLVSIFQAVTSIQEMSLSFVPKLVAAAIVGVVAGPWMLDQLVSWVTQLYTAIPTLAGT